MKNERGPDRKRMLPAGKFCFMHSFYRRTILRITIKMILK